MWEDYLIIASKQSVAIIAGGLLTWLWSLLKDKRAEIKDKDALINSLMANDQATLRQMIVNTYFVWNDRGYMPTVVKESLYKCYERYSACNGNSFVHDLISEIKDFPETKPE